MTLPPRIRRSAVLAVLFGFGSYLTALATPVKFDIPAQSAPAALEVFTKQSGADVMFSASALAKKTCAAVAGEMEPAAALAQLLVGTGFTFSREGDTKFMVSAIASLRTGTIEGEIREEKSGRPVIGAKVQVAGTSNLATTDRRGRFSLENVPAGAHALLVVAEGMQNTRVTDVELYSGSRLTLSAISVPVAQSGTVQLEPYSVRAKKNDVIELDPYAVEGRKEKPFTANMDIPRTINDVQPYYIFDSNTLDQSGATNIGEFLKGRLTMNTTGMLNGQTIGQASGAVLSGNTSSINLRGLGTDQTLILVNGRRTAGVTRQTTNNQPDLNGIPLSAIDRIEVLPSSASGIYGGSAMGGVINVVLKKDYTGGELRAGYAIPWDTDSPTRTLSASYGMTLEGGKTQIMVNGSWSDAKTLLLQDRRGLYQKNLSTILANAPQYIYSRPTNPFLGALPNITANAAAQTTLTLKNGVVLNSPNTYIPAGISLATSTSDLYAALAANSGQWNFDLPATAQPPYGLLQQLGSTPTNKALMASVRRQMLPKLELFAEFTATENNTESVYFYQNPFVLVPAASPVNPFTTAVNVTVLDTTQAPIATQSKTQGMTVGVVAVLPWDWSGEIDYTRSKGNSSYSLYTFDNAARNADLLSGALNPFVDSARFSVNLAKYKVPQSYSGDSNLDDFSLRGFGPLPALPWGKAKLTTGLQYRVAENPENVVTTIYSLTSTNSTRSTTFKRRQLTKSAYAELNVPLVKENWLPFVHVLDLQLAGRAERFLVDTGTTSKSENLSTGTVTYGSPTLNGQPYFSQASYTSSNWTAGFKYEPVPSITVRASTATAFLPPTPAQLVRNPLPNSGTTTVTDPKLGNAAVAVQTISGGNPDLRPQNSKSFNAGVIWEPHVNVLRGVRLNAEYYRIEQRDAISALTAQQIVAAESVFPSRVTRDASGRITLVDISSLNLYKLETEGWDLSADYFRRIGAGTLRIRAAESIILHLKNQYSLTLPEVDGANFPGGGGAPKYKSSGTLSWEWQNWTLGWSAQYVGAYKQYGAIGGPESIRFGSGGVFSNAVAAQGSDTIPSQLYHDLFVGYKFGEHKNYGALWSSSLGGLAIQCGVRNVFDKAPPFDAFQSANLYSSPYGNLWLRSYWVSLRKQF